MKRYELTRYELTQNHYVLNSTKNVVTLEGYVMPASEALTRYS